MADTHTVIQTGYYLTEVMDINGCIGYSDSIYVNTVDVQEYSLINSVTVHPNPSNGFIELRMMGISNSRTQVDVLNLLGNLVHSEEWSGGTASYQMDLYHLLPGIYFVEISLDEDKVSRKIVIR